MSRRVLLLSISLLAALLHGAVLYAWNGAFFDFFQVPYTARSAALGGPHAALAEDASVLFDNPAGFQTVSPQTAVGQTTLSLYDAAPAILGETLTGNISSSTTFRRGWLSLLGPVSLAYVGNGIGVGLFNNTSLRYGTAGPYPIGGEIIEEDLVLIAGYAFRIRLPEEWRSTLSLGFSVPAFVVARSTSTSDVRGVLAGYYTPFGMLSGQPLTLLQGVGIEGGILFSYDGLFSIGVVSRNLAITQRKSYTSMQAYLDGETSAGRSVPLPADISVGIRWSPPLSVRVRPLDAITILVDYNNIFDFLIYPPGATSFLLHIGVGLELRMLEIVRLTAGFYQCLPSGGLQLDLSIFTLTVAVFGREATTSPWGYPVYGYMIGVEF